MLHVPVYAAKGRRRASGEDTTCQPRRFSPSLVAFLRSRRYRRQKKSLWRGTNGIVAKIRLPPETLAVLSALLRCSQQFPPASIHHRLLDPFLFLLTGFAFLPSKVATAINPDEPDVHKGTRVTINRFYRRANYWAGTSMANCEAAA